MEMDSTQQLLDPRGTPLFEVGMNVLEVSLFSFEIPTIQQGEIAMNSFRFSIGEKIGQRRPTLGSDRARVS